MAKRAGTGLDVLTKRLKAIKAKDIMTEYVITTTENTTLAEVAGLMIKTRVSGFPVVGKKGKIVGVITSTDLFIVMDMIKSGDVAQNGFAGIRKPTVKFAMSTDVVRIKKSTTLDKIIALMKYRNLHTLPVMEGNQMVGVIGRRDVFKNFYAAEKDLCL